MIECLNTVKAKPGQQLKKWASVRKALKTIWSKDRIDSLFQKLGEYRAQLSLRVLLLLNANFALHDEKLVDKLDGIQTCNRQIVEVLSLLQSAIPDLRQDFHNGHDSTVRMHQETMAAILTMKDGSSRTIAGPGYSTKTHSRAPTAFTKITQTDTATTYASEGLNILLPLDMQESVSRVMDALYFPRIFDREFSIITAHVKTCEWSLGNKIPDTLKWDGLPTWLETGRGCYWINGKAGSGKSTLLKHLHERHETTQLLKKWAGTSDLVVAAFFFWHAGTSLQNSQSGLLRSLLHAVLRQRPALAPILFPNGFRAAFADRAQEFSFQELERGFVNLVGSTPPGLKICFMVDGLDEYDGDPNVLAELFTKATTSESVKVLLSSRPIPACVDAFSRCPKLRLQDLTLNDINLYIDDKLARNHLMRKLAAVEVGATERLVKEISSKAEGVFLWVILVVKRLLNGLQDYDTISDLMQKLDELPPSLEKLYYHMLESMSPSHRRQGSKLIQLVARSMKTHGEWPMTVLQLSFAEDEDYTKATQAGVSALSQEARNWRCEATEGRMRSRCCGLIEVQDPRTVQGFHLVGYLHRTVAEFLRIESVWTHLVSLTNGTKFDVDQALFSSSLLEMKSKCPPIFTDPKGTVAGISMLRILSYERHMGDNGKACLEVYLPSLMEAMFLYWNADRSSQSWNRDLPPQWIERRMRAVMDSFLQFCKRFQLRHPRSFLLYASSACNSKVVSCLISILGCCLAPPNEISSGDGPSNAVPFAAHLHKYFTSLLELRREVPKASYPIEPERLESDSQHYRQPLLQLYDSYSGREMVWRSLLGYAQFLAQDIETLSQWVLAEDRDEFLDLLIDIFINDVDPETYLVRNNDTLSTFLQKLRDAPNWMKDRHENGLISKNTASSLMTLAAKLEQLTPRKIALPLALRVKRDSLPASDFDFVRDTRRPLCNASLPHGSPMTIKRKHDISPSLAIEGKRSSFNDHEESPRKRHRKDDS